MKSIVIFTFVILVSFPVCAQIDFSAAATGRRTTPNTRGNITRSGFNPSVGISNETLWPFGDERPKPATALLMSIVSTSADDNPAGLGAGSVRIVCLNDNFKIFEQTLGLNGLIPVPMGTPCKRVHFARVATIGALGLAVGEHESNIGDILIQNGGTTYEAIPAGENVIQTLAITIPAGFVGHITLIELTAEVTQTMSGTLVIDWADGIRTKITRHVETIIVVRVPICLDAGTDIEIQGVKSGGSDAMVAGAFNVKLTDSVTGVCP